MQADELDCQVCALCVHVALPSAAVICTCGPLAGQVSCMLLCGCWHATTAGRGQLRTSTVMLTTLPYYRPAAYGDTFGVCCDKLRSSDNSSSTVVSGVVTMRLMQHPSCLLTPFRGWDDNIGLYCCGYLLGLIYPTSDAVCASST